MYVCFMSKASCVLFITFTPFRAYRNRTGLSLNLFFFPEYEVAITFNVSLVIAFLQRWKARLISE